ncbi:holo-[acyl-carrier protein] synthase [Lentibacillus halodurans]|uniref:Holo-[acyl-carrier-protein] synthase n=1 Tax=Lentibacillus halodurans TaxID=237679 RepID=A0A1I1ALB5_9BACI|nr:holo-ACP synthase [Lentibacillus halodurans]SFB38825.1 holo-[acyl-carrier protein] synthase [Lentibacillus halodurans]
MIKGIGIDMIELDRIQHNMRQNNRFADRILTYKEKTVLETLTNERRRVEYLAGRFTAKEAFSKAVGSGIGKLSFKHIEVTSNTYGAPEMNVAGYEDWHIFVSVTHSRDYAVAQVVLEEQN